MTATDTQARAPTYADLDDGAMKNEGGPAFPVEGTFRDERGEDFYQPGMSLRDWFAGQALSRSLSDGVYTDSEGMKGVAEAAYEMADAMLKARDTE